MLTQSITINWQNDQFAGQDVVDVTVPGIGRAEVVCSPDTQWIRFFPSNLGFDTEMWAAIFRDNETAVRAANRQSPAYGPDFNLGLNEYTGQAQAQGSMTGIISSRGPFGAENGSGPAPTSFHLSWHWDFTSAAAARCYVAGTATTPE